MRFNHKFQIIFIIACFIISSVSSQHITSKIKPFIPEIVSSFPNVRDLAISPLENEMYFTIQSHLEELSSIAYCKLKNGLWSKPEIAFFSGKFQDLEPFFTPDGLKLFFVSNRPLDDLSNKIKDFDIWYIERSNIKSKWSKPINLGLPINTKNNEFYPSLCTNRNLYYTSDGPTSKGKDDIFMSAWENGSYGEPISLSDSINSPGYEFNAYIAPDETYLLYTAYNRSDGMGSGDLYISFNQKNNSWTKSKNVGKEINSSLMDYCPLVFSKSNTLYFTSKRSNVPKEFNKPQNMQQLLKKMNEYENGHSRIYQTTFAPNKFRST